jgi:hypothetical protein
MFHYRVLVDERDDLEGDDLDKLPYRTPNTGTAYKA